MLLSKKKSHIVKKMWASLYSMHIGTSYSLEGCVNISTDCKNIVILADFICHIYIKESNENLYEDVAVDSIVHCTGTSYSLSNFN